MKTVKERTCQRCGTCCLATAFSLIREEDTARWIREGRNDILHIIENWHPLFAGDHVISSENGKALQVCPFLTVERSFFACSIYETRPLVCREYIPGSSILCPNRDHR